MTAAAGVYTIQFLLEFIIPECVAVGGSHVAIEPGWIDLKPAAYGRIKLVYALTAWLVAGLLACAGEPGPATGAVAASGEPSSAAPRRSGDVRWAEVRLPGGRVIAAEISDTPERVQRGYMFREVVRDDEGMLFVFGVLEVHSFWMKNTLVPLDIIWLDESFTVVHIHPSAPPCKADPCPSYGTVRKASYVLELRGGSAAREGLKIGDRLAVVLPAGAEVRR